MYAIKSVGVIDIKLLGTIKKMTERLIKSMLEIKKETPVLVCIDGIDGSGKTIFAKRLTNKIQSIYKNVILCSVDNFHNPKKIRYRKGKDSDVGFYEDSYNYSRLITDLLEPFKKGKGVYIDSIFDVNNDAPTISRPKEINKDSILIVEGIFLQRPELFKFWDLRIYLDVDFETTLKRNINRQIDKKRIGRREEIILRYKRRYMPGQKLYFNEAEPKENANIVIDNSDYNNPSITKYKAPNKG